MLKTQVDLITKKRDDQIWLATQWADWERERTDHEVTQMQKLYQDDDLVCNPVHGLPSHYSVIPEVPLSFLSKLSFCGLYFVLVLLIH